MNITILVSSIEHPVNSYLELWASKNGNKNNIEIVFSKNDLVGGDLLFLISCSEIILKADREKFSKALVLHASDLPKGRGWSPHIWDIIHGAKKITLSLLEAEDKVDSGDIWQKTMITVPETALHDEINKLIFEAEMALMDYAVKNFNEVVPLKQKPLDPEGSEGYWRKRTPEDSEIDIHKSIDEQFDLIRVSDPDRFPAFFVKNGKKFKLKVESIDG